jgi:IS5 family transposase
MSQMTFAEAEFQNKKRKTRREVFLERMDKLIPWKQLERKVTRYYLGKSATGRPPYPLNTMLRVHFMQLFYNLSDPAMEDTLYEIESMRHVAGLHLDRIPDETTILNFRRLLEKQDLGKKLFEEVNRHLGRHGLMLRAGSIVDATIISAPSSTKNKDKARDPEMHQAKKGNQWHFGMKMHIGVDNELGLIHSMVSTPAHISDIAMAEQLLHGDEASVWGDAGYQGIDKRAEHQDREVDWYIAMRPGKVKALGASKKLLKAERKKASIRAKVEHPFFYIKRLFGYDKVRYRGLAKNANRLHLLAAFTNLLRSEPYLTA